MRDEANLCQWKDFGSKVLCWQQWLPGVSISRGENCGVRSAIDGLGSLVKGFLWPGLQKNCSLLLDLCILQGSLRRESHRGLTSKDVSDGSSRHKLQLLVQYTLIRDGVEHLAKARRAAAYIQDQQLTFSDARQILSLLPR